MKKLILTLCLTIAVLLGSSGVSYALPKCEGDYKPTWDRCIGDTILPPGTTPANTGDHYLGPWEKGKPNGIGLLTGKKNGNFIYKGGFKDGGAHGQGTMNYSNGDKYVGEWKNDKQHGQGTRTSPRGDKYVGGWRDGEYHGQGTIIYSSGGKYVGEYKDGMQHGQGTYISPRGHKYVGEYQYNKPHGQGTATSANGRVKEGIFKDGKFLYAQKNSPIITARKPSPPSFQKGVTAYRSGDFATALPECPGTYSSNWNNCKGETILPKGVTPSNTGDHYDGEWKDGKPHGKGVLTGVKNKNLKQVGSFKYGNASGWGTLIDNGSKYVGEFENDKQNGLGKIIFPDGNSYIGEWKNGKFNGMGIYFVSGSMLGGKFKDGKLLGLNDNGKLKKSPLPRCRPSDRWGWRNFAERCSGDAKVIAYKPVTPSNAIEYRPIIVYSGQRKPPKWNGTVYSGELTKYKTPHGYGMVTRKNRQVILGTWKKGKLIIPGSVKDAQNLLQVSEHVTPTKSSLPRCKNSPSTREPSYWGWTDCWGTLTHNFVTKFKHNLTYVGEFKDSAYHGEGTYFETDTGNIYAGNFACGHIAVVTEISPNGAKSITDLTNELPSTCKRDVAFDKQITGLSIKEKEDMKSMSEIYQNYHPLKLCQKSRLISNRELKVIQKQTNKILKGMFFDFAEPKRSKSVFKKLKDSAWDHSILELDKNKTYQMSQFLGLGKENLSRDIRSKLKPMCSAYKGQLDNFENILNMAIREDAKKSGKTRKRDF